MRQAWINWKRYVPALCFKTTGQLAVSGAKRPVIQAASCFPPVAGYATKSDKVKRKRKKKAETCSDAQVEDNNKPPRTSYPFLGRLHSFKPPAAELNKNTCKQDMSQHNFDDLCSNNNENCTTG